MDRKRRRTSADTHAYSDCNCYGEGNRHCYSDCDTDGHAFSDAELNSTSDSSCPAASDTRTSPKT